MVHRLYTPRRATPSRMLCTPYAMEGRTDPEAEVIRGYCGAVRSALTDDGRPPLAAAGLQLHDRLNAIAQSLERVEKRGPCPRR
jgi:hypothetical protein